VDAARLRGGCHFRRTCPTARPVLARPLTRMGPVYFGMAVSSEQAAALVADLDTLSKTLRAAKPRARLGCA
jgi:hypothetical protein